MCTHLPPVTLRTFIKAWLVIIWGVAQRVISFEARMWRKSRIGWAPLPTTPRISPTSLLITELFRI